MAESDFCNFLHPIKSVCCNKKYALTGRTKNISDFLTSECYTCTIRVTFEEVLVMQRKLTVTIDEEVYYGLRAVIGPRKISRFIEELVRPHVVKKDMYAAYKEMAADRVRESEALEWAEGTFGDLNDEER